MQNQIQRRERAAAELAAHNPDLRSAEIVDSLSSGLTQLRDLMALRLHEDVELQFGVDSMRAPLSSSQEVVQIRRACAEIDAFAAVTLHDEITRGGYVDSPGEWLFDWIIQLQSRADDELPPHDRAQPYRGLSENSSRQRLALMLHQAVPESIKTPQVLFLLFPPSIRIVAAVAFGDSSRAGKLRAEQVALLSAIGDCRDCRGHVLGNAQTCRPCGNPLWNFAWLRAV